MFVGRQAELARLDAFLNAALAGQGQVCFVAGEPGSGKTALTREFVRRAQIQHRELIAATGDCNAQTGAGESFLPFRELLDVLTGGGQASPVTDAAAAENSLRLRKILAKSGQILLDAAPELIGTLIPPANLAMKLGKIVAEQIGLSEKIADLARRPATRPGLPHGTLEQEHIFEQCTNYLRALAAEQPLLLVLDDLHWADASSINLLFHIGRRIGQSRSLIIGAYRPEEVLPGQDGGAHPLEKLQAEFKRYFGEVIVDLRQGEDAVTQAFVDACVDSEPNRLGYDFRHTLCRHTGGNPLFVVELLGHMRQNGHLVKDAEGEWIVARDFDWKTLPKRIEGVIEERLQRLGQTGRATLSTASVEGQSFTAEIIARLQITDERELIKRLSGEMSRQHQLVEAAGIERLGPKRLSRYRFRHNLFQQYLYNGLDEIERTYLHEDLGNALETLYEGRLDDVAVQLAWHFELSGLADKAARYHRRAGELAATRYAHDEAIQHYGRALALTPDTDPAARCALLLAREAVLGWQGKRAQQAQDLAALAALAERQDARTQAEIHLRRAEHARVTGRYDQAQAFADAAAAAAEQAADPTLAARVYALRGNTLMHSGNYAEAQTWLDQALRLAVSERVAPLAARTVYDLGLTAYYRGQYLAAEDHFNCALGMYNELEDQRGQINALLMIGTVQGKQGDYNAAHTHLEHALGLCRKIGWRHGETYILGNLGDTYLDLGRYDLAGRYHEHALALCREIQDREGEAVSLGMLGLIQLRLGDPAAAETLFRQALAIQSDIGYRRGLGYVLTYLGHALADRQEYTAAAQAFGQALAVHLELDAESGLVTDVRAGLARVALAQGDPAQAARDAGQALDWLDAHGEIGVEYPAQVYLICYRALTAGTDLAASLRGQTALQRGRAFVQAQAARIHDPNLQRSYLENIPFNRQLLAA